MKLKIYYQENQQINTKTIGIDELYNLPKNIIKIKQLKSFKEYISIPLSTSDDIKNLFKELNIILNTHLSLKEAIDILLKSSQNIKINKVLVSIKFALENGQPLVEALQIYKSYLGELPILFLDMGIKNGNINESINALTIILTKTQKAKKDFIEALTYPIFLAISLVLSFILIFNFVIPKFEQVFLQFSDNLPFATKALLFTKDFLYDFHIFIFVFIIGIIFSFKHFYKKYKTLFDKVIVSNIPIFSDLYRDFILYKFLLSLSSLVKANYQFINALKNSKSIVTNEFILYKINQLINDINNGSTISQAFNDTKLFNDTTIRLLHIAQKSNKLETVLNDIVNVYQEKLDDNIKLFSSSIGPLFIGIIAMFVLWLVFALMLPMWDLGSVLN